MPSFNKVIICGHLTRDVELKSTQGGATIASFTLAANRKWKTEAGETKEEVTFVDCVAFNVRGDRIAEYVRKGHPLLIEGHLRQEQWEDNNTGQKRSRIRVVVDGFTLINSKGSGGGGAEPGEEAPPRGDGKTGKQKAREQGAGATEAGPVADDDVPF